MSLNQPLDLSDATLAETAAPVRTKRSFSALDGLPSSILPSVKQAAPLALPDVADASIALVHDWLTVYSGSERVLEQMIALHPNDDVFAAIDFLPEAQRGFLGGKRPGTSFAQYLPLMRKHYRKWLPLLMLAVEQIDVSHHDLVISSSAAIAKGVLTGPEQLHISYVHSPMRYAWDLQHEYLHDSNLDHGIGGFLARCLLHNARFWDLRTTNGVDHYIANSHFIAKRIWKVYRREAAVIYPPVDTDRFQRVDKKDDFFLTVSRMVPYKKIPLIVEAFARMPERRLVVIGDGPDMKKVKQLATPNIEILGFQPAAALTGYMQRARAFVFAAQEDFGISPVEAQACGTPVIAYGRGGALETIRGEHPLAAPPTGLFFHRQTADAIVAAVQEFERREALFSPRACRENAERFSVDNFRRRYGNFVQHCWDLFAA
jgi:glycosyltransferase involved in cell wall biosynthesis